MKNFKSKKMGLAIALIGMTPMLTGCGNMAPLPSTGQLANQFGYNGQYGGYFGAGGCVPITSPIGFTASGYSTANSRVLAGYVPGYGQFGDLRLTGGGGYGGVSTGQKIDGSLTMQITLSGNSPISMMGSSYYNGGIPSVPGYQVPGQAMPGQPGMGQPSMGMLTISPVAQNKIVSAIGMSSFGMGGMPQSFMQPGMNPGMPGMPGMTPGMPGMTYGQGPCVSAMGINIGLAHLNSGSVLYNGYVYLYMNGAQPGAGNVQILQF